MLAGCIAGSWYLGRQARERTQEVLYLRQAAAHVDSASTIVFESNPAIAQVLVDSGTHYSLSQLTSAPAALLEPDCVRVLREAAAANGLEAVGALVFLHELVTPSGARRIVAIQFLPYYLDGRSLPGAGLVAHIFEAGGLLSGPTLIGESHARLLIPMDETLEPPEGAMGEEGAFLGHPTVPASSGCAGIHSPVLREAFDPWGLPLETLRWYAGQPDELDPTHFTIDYEIAGKRGTIDGYLSDDGQRVRMQARQPPENASAPAGMTRISTSAALR